MVTNIIKAAMAPEINPKIRTIFFMALNSSAF